ncbi:YbaY family lipoprotein [Dyella sp.]|uniref:YbaY family lipoprotein n=1 Tax=Dyella sp. TaxID=1869338 RepID=UPI002ED4F439
MRRIVWSLMSVAALALAGCNSSSDSSQSASGNDSGSAAAPARQANKVSGSVALQNPANLSPNAKLEITLVDVSTEDGNATLATKTISPVPSMPQQFELTFNPADINPADGYNVKAVLTDGEQQYAPALQSPVLTKGAPNTVSIILTPTQTAGDKELAAFKDVQAHIGAMKITNGTKLEKDVSRGWQVFREGGNVKFIREQVDYGDKGFTSTDYAYKDGKPWVVVQQKKSNKDAKPSSTERAGWGQDGALVLKQHEANGKTDTLSDSDAADLQKQAQTILSLAGGKGK